MITSEKVCCTEKRRKERADWDAVPAVVAMYTVSLFLRPSISVSPHYGLFAIALLAPYIALSIHIPSRSIAWVVPSTSWMLVIFTGIFLPWAQVATLRGALGLIETAYLASLTDRTAIKTTLAYQITNMVVSFAGVIGFSVRYVIEQEVRRELVVLSIASFGVCIHGLVLVAVRDRDKAVTDEEKNHQEIVVEVECPTSILASLRDSQVWVLAALMTLTSYSIYTLSNALPYHLVSLGLDIFEVELVSALPVVLALVPGIIVSSFADGRHQWSIISCAVFGILGCAAFTFPADRIVQIAGLIAAAGGASTTAGLIISWAYSSVPKGGITAVLMLGAAFGALIALLVNDRGSLLPVAWVNVGVLALAGSIARSRVHL